MEQRIAKISEIAQINPAVIRPTEAPAHIRYIDISSVGEGFLIIPPQELAFNQAPSRARRLVAAGDTVLSTVRPNRRSMFQVTDELSNVIVSTGFAVLRARSDICDPDYLYRVAFQQRFTEYLVANEIGAAYPAVTTDIIGSFELELPPLEVQQRIAKTLKSLDDKIELNRRMNETLEAMAQAIFRDWFVDFGPVRRKLDGATDPVNIMGGVVQKADEAARLAALFPETLDDQAKPVGWKSEPIGSLAKVQSGKRPPSKMSTPDKFHKVPVYGGNGVSWFTDKVLFDPPFLITGRVGTLGTVFRVDQRVWVSDNALCCFPKKRDALDLLYFHLQELDYAALNSGSTQPLLTQSTLTAQQVVVGNHLIVSAFSEYAGRLIKMIGPNNRENDLLTQTRDLLLPKLMSGDIRLKDVENIVEAAE